jgi:serine/threonine-protein kinase
VPSAFDDVVARGMAKDPDDRYGTAGGLARAAQRALQGGGGATARTGGATGSQGRYAATVVTEAPDPTRDLPVPVPRDPDAHRRSRSWVLPTVIAIAAALIVGAIGIVIGMLANNLGQPAGPAAATSTAGPSPGGPLPPLVTGPDQSALHQSCDQGFTATTVTGFGSRAGRGTPETSCLFTNSVLTSYWAEYGNASPLPRAVSAPGAVDCSKVPGALCDGSNFLMHCQQFPGDSWITCTGGKNARVYLW